LLSNIFTATAQIFHVVVYTAPQIFLKKTTIFYFFSESIIEVAKVIE